jgi:N-acetylglucosaminyldiphosphoundecaprenol N-acetyl-beta-D-mannosaminyltransferase
MDDKNHRERIDILGVPIDRVDMKMALIIFEELLVSQGCSLIVTPNSEIVVMAEKDAALRDVIASADLVIPDGIGLVYAARLLRKPLSERVTGIDFLSAALKRLSKTHGSAYFLGSKPGVAEAAADRIKIANPGLVITGTRHGFFAEDEEMEIVEEINRSGADLLCVALGAPRQEMFIARHRHRLVPKVAIGVGGSLDVFAGVVKRAPAFYQNNGLEWLYRLAQQPSRIKRTAALPRFMARVLLGRGKRHSDE